MTYTAEQFIKSPRFIEIATEDAISMIAKKNGQTVEMTKQALIMMVPNVVEGVTKLVKAAAEHCAKEANAGKLW